MSEQAVTTEVFFEGILGQFKDHLKGMKGGTYEKQYAVVAGSPSVIIDSKYINLSKPSFGGMRHFHASSVPTGSLREFCDGQTALDVRVICPRDFDLTELDFDDDNAEVLSNGATRILISSNHKVRLEVVEALVDIPKELNVTDGISEDGVVVEYKYKQGDKLFQATLVE